ncbi:MAG: class C sortase, partial [Ruminococcus sp.]|nr:class C sortase [Ruminococcus sp.]
MRAKRTKLLISFFSILIVVGLLLMFHPQISNYIYNFKQTQIIEDYNYTFNVDDTNKKPINNSTLNNLKTAVKNYNTQIYKEGQKTLFESTVQQQAAINLSDYDFKNNIYGYISVDKINLKMSLYLGANENNMSLGAAVVGGSSIPYGGIDTNAVIAGHCGYRDCNYFRYIDTLEKDDIVKIVIPFGSLYYRVVSKRVIKPTDCQSLKIQSDKDMITLFTCY